MRMPFQSQMNPHCSLTMSPIITRSKKGLTDEMYYCNMPDSESDEADEEEDLLFSNDRKGIIDNTQYSDIQLIENDPQCFGITSFYIIFVIVFFLLLVISFMQYRFYYMS